ncbi:hypothetical protein IJ674_00550 [bacterium]|nr:hypothetical protein [bacterium]
MSFYERYEKCCQERGILPKSQYAADMLGCTKSSISAFAKSGKAPAGLIVANAAKMLNVTSDYLLEIIDNPRNIDVDFSDQELSILSDIRELNTEGKESAQAMIKGLLTNGIYKKSNSVQKKVNKK